MSLPIFDETSTQGDEDKFREECGLIGIWNNPEASNLAYLGLYAQQHRGQDGAGVATFDKSTGSLRVHRGLGLVSEAFDEFDFTRLPGQYAIGHVRYATFGVNQISNVQPFQAETACGRMAIAHNGNLTNGEELRRDLIDAGAIFSATSDTEVLMHLIARHMLGTTLMGAVVAALGKIQGAFSLVMLFEDRIVAVRDPNGFRPLVLGDLSGQPVIASESCAFDLLGARLVRELKPGEVLEISGKGEMRSSFPLEKTEPTPCIFEYIYFARPDSNVFGQNVYSVRKELGRQLAEEAPVDADIVVPVPDSGVAAALGYAESAKIPFELALIRNHYVGRTFIEPQQSIRDFGVKVKLNPNRGILEGKRVIIVDDSIVRGTTTRKLITMLRDAGAREVHVRISAPPTTSPCFYGIATPTKDHLIAARMSVSEIREWVGADSLAYLSETALYRAVKANAGSFCDACFTGRYPVAVPLPKKASLRVVS